MDGLYAMDVSKKAENKIKILYFFYSRIEHLTQQLATSRYEKKVPSHVKTTFFFFIQIPLITRKEVCPRT